MMKNKYAGKCARCKKRVPPLQGRLETLGEDWIVLHKDCAPVGTDPHSPRVSRNGRERYSGWKSRIDGKRRPEFIERDGECYKLCDCCQNDYHNYCFDTCYHCRDSE